MNNLIQAHENTLQITAPAALTGGTAILMGRLLAVPIADAASGALAAVRLKGVVELPCLSTDAPALGAALYWDNTNKRLTVTATSNTLVGIAAKAKASGETTVWILLNALNAAS